MADFFPESYGAVGDGKHDDTYAIRQACAACRQNGGGRVVLSGGCSYLSGSVELGAYTEFHLQAGAKLKASPKLEDYHTPGTTDDDSNRGVGTPVTRKPAFVFLYAYRAEHVSITGQGIIDGNAVAFVHRVNPYYVTGDFYPRPTTVYLEHCNHLTVQGVTLQNAPFWTLHMAGCEDVLVEGIRILNPLDVANSDGIDPDHCQNVRIANCHVVCADDCIVLKNTRGNDEYLPTRNVVISGCTLVSTSAALKIGTEGVADFENVLVENCVITASNRGISIQVRDEGNVRNVSFCNIIVETRRFSDEWWGKGEPIALTSFDRDAKTTAGNIEHIRFENIQISSENGILLCGQAGRIRNIAFRDIRMVLQRQSRWPGGRYDLRPGYAHPQFLELPAHAVVMQNIQNVRIHDFYVKDLLGKTTHGLVWVNGCDNVTGEAERDD